MVALWIHKHFRKSWHSKYILFLWILVVHNYFQWLRYFFSSTNYFLVCTYNLQIFLIFTAKQFIFLLFSLIESIQRMPSCTAVYRPLNPWMPIMAKTFRQFWWNLFGESLIGKIFEGEMFIRTLPITLLQIFCKIIFNCKVIVKSIPGPDDNFYRKSLMG